MVLSLFAELIREHYNAVSIGQASQSVEHRCKTSKIRKHRGKGGGKRCKIKDAKAKEDFEVIIAMSCKLKLICNPSTLRGRGGRIETNLANTVKLHLY